MQLVYVQLADTHAHILTRTHTLTLKQETKGPKIKKLSAEDTHHITETQPPALHPWYAKMQQLRLLSC